MLGTYTISKPFTQYRTNMHITLVPKKPAHNIYPLGPIRILRLYPSSSIPPSCNATQVFALDPPSLLMMVVDLQAAARSWP